MTLINKVKEILTAENNCTVETLANTLLNKAVEDRICQIKNEIVRNEIKQASEKVVTDNEALPLATEQAIVALEVKIDREIL